MDRNESADDFADCVVRRTEFDTVMKPGLVVATMVVPALIALVMVTVIMDANVGTVFTQDGVRAGIVTALVTECCVIGFMLYILSGRTASHQRRDDIWTRSLIGYARSKGADTGELERLADRMHAKGRSPLRILSLVLWGFSLILLLAMAFYFGLLTGEIDRRIYILAGAAYVLLILEFLLSTGATYGFPHSHEKAQIEFTEELSSVLDGKGITVEPMRPLVGRPHWVVAILLFIVTLGLFTAVLFLFACRNMNLHIRNQHEYEDDLLNAIIEVEGGNGVRPAERIGRAAGFLRSLF